VLTATLARPVVTRGTWREGGRLELSGLADADVPWSDLVLANAVWDEEHAFPFDIADGLAAVLTPAAVESLAGPRPLPAGAWELRMHVDGEPAGRPLAVAPELETLLPLAAVVDDKKFSLELTAHGRLSIRVLQDLPDEERGRYHQRRQQRTIYTPARAGALTDTVVYSSFQGRQCSDSPLAIHRELVRRDAPLEHLWIVHDGMCRPPETATAVRTGSPEYHEALARARLVVTNDVLPAWFLRRPDQVCVQTGHGTPLRRLAFDHREARRMNRRLAADWEQQVANWQYMLSPNGFSTPLLREAYGFEGELLETGYPRVDVLAHADRAQAVRRRLRIPDGKRTVLYAPTYRDQVADRDGRTRLDLRLDFARLQAALGSDTVLLFRKHHAVFDALPYAMWPYARDVSSYPDATELLLAADVLVTDYSSIAVDFANTGRPMLFYAYDLEQYESTVRGFNVDYVATVPGPVVRTVDELTEALRDPVVDGARYAAFRARFCEHDDGHAAARVVDRSLRW
jgi:CDP-glycerol glycerophosphotransferase